MVFSTGHSENSTGLSHLYRCTLEHTTIRLQRVWMLTTKAAKDTNEDARGLRDVLQVRR